MAEKRGSLFTVRDAEGAIITYTVLGFLYIIGICLYEIVAGWNGVSQMLMRLEATSQYLIGQQLRSLSSKKE